MALSLKHMNEDGQEVDWQLAKDPAADPENQQPNDPPPWSVLTDSDHDNQWVLASGPVVTGVPPDRPTMSDAAQTAGSMADFYNAFSVAIYAVKATRYVLKRGALNAVFPLEPELNPDDAPTNFLDPHRPPRYVCGDISPKYLYDISEGLFNELYLEKVRGRGFVRGEVVNALPRDPLVGILARYYGAMTVSGGVCSMISAVVAGLATMNAYPVRYTGEPNDHTEILVCYHGADHSFCVIGYRGSPWVVADPWVAEPYVLPWEENYFDRAGVQSYQSICVRHRFGIPWGVPILAGAYNRAALDAAEPIQNFPLTRDLIVAAENGIGARNEPDAHVRHALPHMVWRENRWEPNRNIAIAGNRNFHTDHVWQHVTNHYTFNPRDTAPYGDFRRDNKPVVKANQWGNNAGISFD